MTDLGLRIQRFRGLRSGFCVQRFRGQGSEVKGSVLIIQDSGFIAQDSGFELRMFIIQGVSGVGLSLSNEDIEALHIPMHVAEVMNRCGLRFTV